MTGQSHTILLTLTLISAISLEACRSRKKAANLEDSAPSLAVTMKDMRTDDKGQTNFRYFLSGCGEGAVQGKVDKDATGEDPVVNFEVTGLEPGDVCEAEVKIDSIEAYPSKIKFTDSDLVMYKGTNAIVTQGLKGAYQAEINLQPKYFHEVSPTNPTATYELTVPVTFQVPLTAPNTVSAFLYCTPEVRAQPSVYSPTQGNSGAFLFRIIDNQQFSNQHSCNRVIVYEGDILSYSAALNPATARFKATVGQKLTLQQSPVPLSKIQPPPSKVILETIPGKQCDPEKEVFDTVTRKCIPKN